mmetsp:Transcript_57547/g.151484  ORF Transcript_57547/g.151484 Transcript_57547/m.151484 type:complete len:84 (+) Transcript_57547:386-637(+)
MLGKPRKNVEKGIEPLQTLQSMWHLHNAYIPQRMEGSNDLDIHWYERTAIQDGKIQSMNPATFALGATQKIGQNGLFPLFSCR